MTALSLTDWAVLAVIREAPTHGFAVAKELAPAAPLGRVWTVPRPLVYRSIGTLAAAGYAEEVGTEAGAGGPARTRVRATRAGRVAVDRWLLEPVEHVRDLRTALLLKLAMLERRGVDPAPLVRAQEKVLEPIVASLAVQVAGARGFDAVLASWRVESAQAAVRFLAGLASSR